MIAPTPDELRQAISQHRLDVVLEDATLDLTRAAVDQTGMLVIGEPHGARQTPGVLYALVHATGARALAFEWSHEEMDDVGQQFVESGRRPRPTGHGRHPGPSKRGGAPRQVEASS